MAVLCSPIFSAWFLHGACVGLLSPCCQFTFDFKFPVFLEAGPPPEGNTVHLLGWESVRPSVMEREPYIRRQAIGNGAEVSRIPEHFDKIQNLTSAEDPARRDRTGGSLIHRSPATTQGVRAQPHVFILWLVQSMVFDHQKCSPKHMFQF